MHSFACSLVCCFVCWCSLSNEPDQAMGVETFIQPADIINANKKLLLAFCAQLFNTNPNLTVEVRLRSYIGLYAPRSRQGEKRRGKYSAGGVSLALDILGSYYEPDSRLCLVAGVARYGLRQTISP